MDFAEENIPDGTYYWRVTRNSTNENDTDNVSDIRVIKVSPYTAGTKLVYPPEQFYIEENQLSSTQFMWKLSDDYIETTTQSVIQVANDKDFENVLLEKDTYNLFESNLELNSGEYYWRVGVRQANGSIEDFSSAREIKVITQLSPAKFIYPKEAQTIVTDEANLTVSWQEVKGASYYNVSLFDMDGTLIEELSEQTATQAKFNLSTGSYECRVQAVAKEKDSLRKGELSTLPFFVRTISHIELLYPRSNQIIQGATALREPTVFSWQDGADKALSYEFILYKRQANGALSVFQTRKGKLNQASFERLEPGVYTWQVKAISTDGINIDSERRSFTIEQVAALQKAVLTSPSKDFVMGPSYLRNNRVISFTWNVVPSATEYKFTLYKKQENGDYTFINSQTVKENKASLSDLSLLSVGDFKWSVEAYRYAKDGFEEQKSPLSEQAFKIEFTTPTSVHTKETGKFYGN